MARHWQQACRRLLDTFDAMHAELAIKFSIPRPAVLPLDRFDDDLVNVGGTQSCRR
jgi:hypothetical protein